MLEQLRIRGLGVIDEADLEFDPGLTVVTGETGAGKTMIVTALSLLLGARADAGAIRTGTDRLQVEGRWLLPAGSAALERAADAGADVDGHELIAIRSVTRTGRSRAHLGGASVPVAVLTEIGDHLVDLHSQSDQIALLRPTRQLAALDLFATQQEPSAAATLERYRATYRELRDTEAALDALKAAADERTAERDRLLFGLDEIGNVLPTPGEDRALSAEAARLAYADDLQAAGSTAAAALTGDDQGYDDDNALALIGRGRKAVQAMAGHDARLFELGTRLDELAVLAGDLAADLAGYVADTETDPVRLAAIGERRAALGSLTRRYGSDVDAVLAWSAASAARVAELDGSDDRIAELAAARTSLRSGLAELATDLHHARVRAAGVFAERAGAELREFAMPHARLEFVVEPRAQDASAPMEVTFGPDGLDDVELRLAPHPGSPARPLARGASGGELSRVMLACHVVLGAGSDVPTYVFDEVDSGVGGSAAVEVGRRLAQLARTGQVVVVTHLAQVAAFADRHYVVSKDSDGSITSSGLRRVEDDDRVTELARMLAGDEGSDISRAHARELLNGAVRPPAGDVVKTRRRRSRNADAGNTPSGV